MAREEVSASLIDEGEEAGWIVTFADLMSLLLVFFVLLYSISSLNLEKFKVAIESINVSLGGSGEQVGLVDILNVPDPLDTKITIEEITGLRSRQDSMLKDLTDFIEERQLGDHIVLQVLENKIIIQIKGQVLFKSGSAELNREAAPILDEIIEVISEYSEYKVNIKGHTDNVPISTPRFPSNWELSAIRATDVLKYLIEGGIHPARLTATGYGDVMPLVPNNSSENRATNRRVEFVLEKKVE